jgi:hypothetical protein
MSHAGLKRQLIAVPSSGPARQSGRYEIDPERAEEAESVERADVHENIARLLEMNTLSEEELAWIKARSSRPPAAPPARTATSAVFAKEGEEAAFGALQPFYREPTLERVQLQFEDLSLDPSHNPLARSSLEPPAKQHPSVPIAWGLAVGALALLSVGYLAALASSSAPGTSRTVGSPARRAMAPHVVSLETPEPVGVLSNAAPVAPAAVAAEEVPWSSAASAAPEPAQPGQDLPSAAHAEAVTAAAEPAAAAPPRTTLRERVRAWRAREAAARAASAAQSLTPAMPNQPSREDIKAGLQNVRAALQACAGPAHGMSTAHVTIAGTGRVAAATIEGAFAGTPQGSCMARALRGAAFPRFGAPSLQVTYPFRL